MRVVAAVSVMTVLGVAAFVPTKADDRCQACVEQDLDPLQWSCDHATYEHYDKLHDLLLGSP
jgi:hypothetical protein